MNSVTTNDQAGRRAVAAPRDRSGFAVFSAGDAGAAHLRAHRLFDAGRFADGQRELAKWLEGRAGSGSAWVHIHFHMALFELKLGQWDAAYERFRAHILPAAATSEDALTDAPALLWRLALAAPRAVDLPWETVRRTALQRLQRPADPFVELHNLLALAGAGDVENVDRWLAAQPPCEDTGRACVVRTLVLALRAYVTRAYRQAAVLLQRVMPVLAQLGGSLAQQQLFADLAAATRQQVGQERAALPARAA